VELRSLFLLERVAAASAVPHPLAVETP
jgi:hypothetical protein